MKTLRSILPMMMILLFCSCTRAINTPRNTVQQFLTSGTALIIYAFTTGLILGIVFARNGKRKRRYRASGLPVVAAATQISDEEQPLFHKAERELEEENSRLKLELVRLEADNKELQRELKEADRLLGRSNPDSGEMAAPQDSHQLLRYFLQPTDGKFSEDSKVPDVADALYELNCVGSEATFRFIDTPDNVQLAVQYESTRIFVACERSNMPADHTYSIRTDIPGRAVLRGNDWEIVQKAKITYL